MTQCCATMMYYRAGYKMGAYRLHDWRTGIVFVVIFVFVIGNLILIVVIECEEGLCASESSIV